MKDLIVEGRELQNKFSTLLIEVDFGGDFEKVKETSKFDVVIPNSFDSLKKLTGMNSFSLDKVKPKTAFQIFCVVAKKDSTEADVEEFKTIVVISIEGGSYIAVDGNNKPIDFSNVLRTTQLPKAVFQFGRNQGKVIPSKPQEKSLDASKTMDMLYKQAAKDISDFKNKFKEKIGISSKNKLGLGGETIVKSDDQFTVIIPNSLTSLQNITGKDTFNHDISLNSEDEVAYQIFIVVAKEGSKNFNSKEYKIITVYANANNTHDIFDYRDKKISINDLMKITGLPRSTFRYGANEGEIFIHKADYKPTNTIDLLKHLFKNKKEDKNVISKLPGKTEPESKGGIFKQAAKAALDKVKSGFSKREVKEADEDDDQGNDPTPDKTTNQLDSRVILDKEDVKIEIPRSFDYIRNVSKDTKWMASGGTFGGTEFDKYRKEKYTIYIVQLKEKSPNYSNRLLRKIAVLVSPSNQITCYDVMDNLVDITKVIKVSNTARSLYKKMI
jgi:hypothetical protein